MAVIRGVDSSLAPPIPGRWATDRRTDLGFRSAEAAPHRLALIAIAVPVTLLPIRTPVGPANISPIDVLIAGSLVVSLLWVVWARVPIHLPFAIPVGIIVVTGTLAAIVGSYPVEGAVAIAQDLFLLAWAAAIANVCRTGEGLSLVIRSWSWSAVAWAVLLIVALASGWSGLVLGDPEEGGRAAFTFGDSNTAAAYFAVSLMLVLASGVPRSPLARFAAAAAIVVAVVQTGSIAGIVAILPAVVLALLIRTWHRRGPVPAVAGLVAVVLIGGAAMALASSADLTDRARASRFALIKNSIGRLQDSATARELIARQTADLFRTGSALGRGPASTQSSLEAIQAPFPKEAHNDYIAALVERGALGLFGVLLLLAGMTVRTLSVARGLSRPFDRIVPAPFMLAGVLVVELAFSLTHETLHDHTLWTFLGLVAAIHLWCRPRRGGVPASLPRAGGSS